MQIDYTHPQWAEKLLQDSNTFTKPILYKNFFDNNLLSQLDIINLINSVIAKKPKDTIRVYIQRGRRHDYEYKLLGTPLKRGEEIQSWAKTLTAHNDFFILLSQVGKFYDIIIQKFATLFLPLFPINGIPAGGWNVSIIMGQYKKTPFGVHQDDNRQCILHYHLGPGIKEMYVWEEENFKNLTGSSESFFDPKKIKSSAQIFLLEPNDFFLLAANLYHIGYPKNFSISLVISFMTSTIDQYISKAFYESYKSSWACINKKTLPYNMLENIPLQREWCLALSSKNKNKQTLKDWLAESIENKKLSLLSNLGFNEPPTPRSKKINDLENKKIKIVLPFNINYKIYKRNIFIFVRGNVFFVPYYLSIVNIIKALNNNKTYNLQVLFSKLLQKNKMLGLQFLDFLYNNRGVNIY